MCEEWRNDFAAFLRDMGERPKGKSLDRINNDGNYEPGNCRWATQQQQSRNTRRSRMLTVNGETLPLKEWADRAGLPLYLIAGRFRLGWPVERMFIPHKT